MSTKSQDDPLHYYAILGLAPGADIGAIKAAYRARVKSVHPDRNASGRAKEEFQRVVEAYNVLKDAVRRGEYDSTGYASLIEDDDAIPPAAPFACCRCHRVTGQPRYVIFDQVKSYLLWAKTIRIEGIFCRACADRAAIKASTATWALGWWSLPGLLLAPWALVTNLMGGRKPRHVNARMLIRQARAFIAEGDTDLAYAVASQAKRFAKTTSHRRQVSELLHITLGGSRLFKDRWAPWAGTAFVAQLAPLLALPVTLAALCFAAFAPHTGVIGASAGISVAPPSAGELRHVAVDALKLRQSPAERAPVLTLLDRFTTVTTVAKAKDPEWIEVRVPSGQTGFVPVRALYGGSSDIMRSEWCRDHRGTQPQAGEILTRRASGEHQVFIHNEGRTDAVVKFKTPAGNTVMSYFVPAAYHIGVGGIPEGTYLVEFATGTGYSRACGMFTDEMRAQQMPYTLTLRHVSALKISTQASMPAIYLAPGPTEARLPQPISLDRYLAGD